MKIELNILTAGALLASLAQGFGQPVILTQPRAQTIVAGTTAIFSVVATGAPPLSYQWRSYANATTFANIPAATNDTLVLSNAQPTNQRFGVVVTEFGGLSVTSILARLIVMVPAVPPSILIQPVSQVGYIGEAITFSLVATGTPPFSYQWRFNNTTLPNKTSSSLVLIGVQPAHAGEYSAVVTNIAGAVTSQVARLSITAPWVPHQFAGITTLPDKTASLVLSGSVAIAFKPYFDLYPVDVSSNLRDWEWFATPLLTNAVANTIFLQDTEAKNFPHRFYRTVTNHFVTPFPKPTGPHSVGRLSRLLTDPSRTNRYNIPTNSSFMVTFWYPAKAEAGVLPTEYMEKKLASFIPIPYFMCHSYSNPPFADGLTNCPIIIYSHGAGGYRVENAEKAEELASHGYVVVSVDHEDCGATVLPGDNLVLGLVLSPFDALPSRLGDIQVVMDTLSQLDASDPKLAGRLKLGRVGILGWSRGGGVAGEICRVDGRFKAAVLFAPALWWATNLLETGVGKPFVCMVESTDSMLAACWRVCSESLFNKATQDAFWFQIQALHYTFSQDAWIINDEQPPVGESVPTAATRSAAVTMRACMLSFFNKYLRNEDDHLLDDPSTVYTNVYNFRKK